MQMKYIHILHTLFPLVVHCAVSLGDHIALQTRSPLQKKIKEHLYQFCGVPQQQLHSNQRTPSSLSISQCLDNLASIKCLEVISTVQLSLMTTSGNEMMLCRKHKEMLSYLGQFQRDVSLVHQDQVAAHSPDYLAVVSSPVRDTNTRERGKATERIAKVR